jgi:hypothetical protein
MSKEIKILLDKFPEQIDKEKLRVILERYVFLEEECKKAVVEKEKQRKDFLDSFHHDMPHKDEYESVYEGGAYMLRKKSEKTLKTEAEGKARAKEAKVKGLLQALLKEG